MNKNYIKKTIVYYTSPVIIEKGAFDTYEPVTVQSINYKNWRAILDLRTCLECRSLHGKIYDNLDGHLPQLEGRIWYEADINYYEGKRNKHRILWSNDGLIFVTYDHYATFYEIIGENYGTEKNNYFRLN